MRPAPTSMLLAVGLVASLAALPRARAESPEDIAAAKAAFADARRLLDDGKVAEACAKFEASRKLVVRTGTLLSLGDCYERLGRTASAWGAFSEAVSVANRTNDGLAGEEGKRRAATLERKLVRLRINLASGADLPGLEVKRDGVVIARELLGTAVPVDPGTATIAASAPGRRPYSTDADLKGAGRTIDVTIPVLERAETGEVVGPAGGGGGEQVAPPRAGGRGKTRRIVALSTAAAGVVAIGIGSYFGLDASSTWKDAELLCPRDEAGTRVCTTQEGHELAEDADRSATISNVAFGVGIAAVATGAILWVTAPSRSAATEERSAGLSWDLRPTAGGAGLVVTGRF